MASQLISVLMVLLALCFATAEASTGKLLLSRKAAAKLQTKAHAKAKFALKMKRMDFSGVGPSEITQDDIERAEAEAMGKGFTEEDEERMAEHDAMRSDAETDLEVANKVDYSTGTVSSISHAEEIEAEEDAMKGEKDTDAEAAFPRGQDEDGNSVLAEAKEEIERANEDEAERSSEAAAFLQVKSTQGSGGFADDEEFAIEDAADFDAEAYGYVDSSSQESAEEIAAEEEVEEKESVEEQVAEEAAEDDMQSPVDEAAEESAEESPEEQAAEAMNAPESAEEEVAEEDAAAR